MTRKEMAELVALPLCNQTAGMTVKETAEFLSKRQALGWPGSVSIRNKPLKRTGDR